MPAITLSPELIDYFKISKYRQAKPSGQKTVFFVTIEGVEYALKIINIVDKRFEREVRIGEKYSKAGGIPKIVRIENFSGNTIILEEYIDGKDLCDIQSTYNGDDKKICNLLLKVGSIMKPIWIDEYVHRDLKPQNIRIQKDGNPVVLDFGIARALNEESITATGVQPYTWSYASPEQYAGKKKLISFRTDFFCMGIIAYFLLTHNLPFGNNEGEINATFQKGDISVKTQSEMINNFCNSVFKINPSERPRKIDTFLKLLEL